MRLQSFGRKALVGVSLALGIVSAGNAPAQPMAEVETTLSDWGGPKQVVLRTDLADPLAAPLVQDLIEQFLNAGFNVDLGNPQTPPGQGMVADIRSRETQTILVLSNGLDLSVIAIQRFQDTATPVIQERGPTVSAQRVRANAVKASSGRPPDALPWPVGPIRLERPARGVAITGLPEDQVHLALLFDDSLQLVRLSPTGIKAIARHDVQESQTRGLHVSSGDLDGDGEREIAATWAEDSQGVYDGTDSQLHSWIFRPEEAGWKALTDDLRSHLRIAGDRAVQQERGVHTPFGGPITERGPLAGPGTSHSPVPWGLRDLFSFTPLGVNRGLTRDENHRLQLVLEDNGQAVEGGLLLDGLGAFQGPYLAIRLETIEYRSGFEKEDRITEKHYSLPPRLERTEEGIAYTILRGRSEGLPLLGRAKGKDQVVRVRNAGNTLALEHPFPAVDAFVVDFAIFHQSDDQPAAVLLLNDKADGLDRAYLLVQTAR